jgi:hypothetical protein
MNVSWIPRWLGWVAAAAAAAAVAAMVPATGLAGGRGTAVSGHDRAHGVRDPASANPASSHYADQTELFSHRGWAYPYFCPAQVAAHAVSTETVHSR